MILIGTTKQGDYIAEMTRDEFAALCAIGAAIQGENMFTIEMRGGLIDGYRETDLTPTFKAIRKYALTIVEFNDLIEALTETVNHLKGSPES